MRVHRRERNSRRGPASCHRKWSRRRPPLHVVRPVQHGETCSAARLPAGAEVVVRVRVLDRQLEPSARCFSTHRTSGCRLQRSSEIAVWSEQGARDVKCHLWIPPLSWPAWLLGLRPGLAQHYLPLCI